MKIHGSARVSQAHTSANKVQPNFNAFWKFLRPENSAWDSLGVNFWSRDFLEFCWKPYGFFWVLIFPPFDHPHHLKSGVPEYPLLPSPSPGTDTVGWHCVQCVALQVSPARDRIRTWTIFEEQKKQGCLEKNLFEQRSLTHIAGR